MSDCGGSLPLLSPPQAARVMIRTALSAVPPRRPRPVQRMGFPADAVVMSAHPAGRLRFVPPGGKACRHAHAHVPRPEGRMTDALVDPLAAALDGTGHLVAAVPAGQWD